MGNDHSIELKETEIIEDDVIQMMEDRTCSTRTSNGGHQTYVKISEHDWNGECQFNEDDADVSFKGQTD